MSPSRARRWLLLADLFAVILAVIASESGIQRLTLERPVLLASVGAYLIVTGIVLFFVARRPSESAERPAGTAVLGRRGPAFLAYGPRLIMGIALLAYVFRP